MMEEEKNHDNNPKADTKGSFKLESGKENNIGRTHSDQHNHKKPCFSSEKTNDSSNPKGISTEKRAGELKEEIPMWISKSWNDLIISCN